MVDINNFTKVSRLYQERNQITTALKMLDNEHYRITAVGLGPKPQPDQPGGGMMSPPFIVQTEYMEYPAQMVTTIKQALEQRHTAIAQELSALGVTGAETR